MNEPSRNVFYAGVPVFDRFTDVLDPALYQPLPAGWHVGVTDVVSSTQAIAAGRYKLVNTVGASIIAAMTNALEGWPFPFVFGGDGASFAVPEEKAELARATLAATSAWARDECDLDLRAALVPLAEIRAAGHDVRTARFAPSPAIAYAMFSGGGLAWAESETKAGRFAVPAAAIGARPDLSGLSCRWNEMPGHRGLVLSIIVLPVSGDTDPAFHKLTLEIVESIADLDRESAGRPVPEEGPPPKFSLDGLKVEARTLSPGLGPLWLRQFLVYAHALVGFALFRIGRKVGRFDPSRYRRELASNADFRKYDDGLRMTIDCTPAFADRLEARLAEAEGEGIVRFGLHRQKSAIMTCFVPSVASSDHGHFIDGASGGYAAAAAALKARAFSGEADTGSPEDSEGRAGEYAAS